MLFTVCVILIGILYAAKMNKKEHVFKIPFIIFLNEILLKLDLPLPTFKVNQIKDNLYRTYIHIKGIIEDEPITYVGRCFKDKEEAKEEAARASVQELQKIYNFHIDDFNFQVYQFAQGNFEDSQTLYEEFLTDYRKLENELKSLNGIEGTRSSTNDS